MSECVSASFLKACSFRIILKKEAKEIEFVVQAANLPGFSLGEMPVAWMAQNQRRPGDNLTWTPLALTLVCDENLQAFKNAHNLMMRLKDPETGFLGDASELFDAKLVILTNKNNLQHVVTFYDSWIQTVGDLSFSHTTPDDAQLSFDINLVYDYYKFE